ncbi:MAG: glycerol-3-phosphate 1-O-acyltransferase PlsY [Minisyncoccales bacterium]
MNFYILVILSYLLGSIPFGYLIPKFKNVDIRRVGSKGTGATNVSRALGLKYAVLVGVLDILKASLPVFLAFKYLNNEVLIGIVMFVAVLGHIFPVWLKFKGGKGIATFVPSMVVILGVVPALVLFLIWVALLKITRTMSLNNLVLLWLLPFAFWYFSHSGVYFILGVSFYLITLWAHRENVYRLYNKKELKL